MAIKVWDVASGTLLRTIDLGREYDFSEILTDVFFLSGARVVVGMACGPLRVIDPRTGRLHRELPEIEPLCVSRDGGRLLAQLVGQLCLLDTASWREIWRRPWPESVAAAVVWIERVRTVHLDGQLRHPLGSVGPRPRGR